MFTAQAWMPPQLQHGTMVPGRGVSGGGGSQHFLSTYYVPRSIQRSVRLTKWLPPEVPSPQRYCPDVREVGLGARSQPRALLSPSLGRMTGLSSSHSRGIGRLSLRLASITFFTLQKEHGGKMNRFDMLSYIHFPPHLTPLPVTPVPANQFLQHPSD